MEDPKDPKEEPTEEPKEEPTEEPKEEPKHEPNDEKASAKYRQQRDEARKALDDQQKALSELQDKIKGLEASDTKVKELQEQIEHMNEQATEAKKQAEFARVNSARLATAGCVDVDLALKLLDENGDVDGLKDEKPYLFGTVKGSTGLKPVGASQNTEATLHKARKAAGLE
jgi:predicted RNase H-like nuclease (RuvC/YqgF family)